MLAEDEQARNPFKERSQEDEVPARLWWEECGRG
jgi:hypothetical protein